MKITTIEIEVVRMTSEEENILWKEWQKHYTDKQDIFVDGYLLENWDTDDGHNYMLLNKNGEHKWFPVSINEE